MARRSAASAWARLIGRSVNTLTRQATLAGTRAARKVAKKVAKQVAKQVARQATPAPAKPAAKKRRAAAARPPPKPAKAGNPSGWTWGRASSPAGTRRYALYQPTTLPPGESVPLVVMLHGCTQDAEGFARSTGMNRLADREHCLVLYPEQDRLANPQACWNWYDTRHGRAQAECALILRAIDQVARRHPIDLARVVVAGLSAGAGTAALLASLHPGRFAAVVMHSGIAPGTADATLNALRAMQGRRKTPPLPAVAPGGAWPPLLVIQGLADAVVSPRNGRAAALAWAAAVGARAGAPRTVQRGQRHAMHLTDFTHRGRVAATLAEVAQLGHAWSGGAAGQPFSDPAGPDACRLLWAFAARQFRVAQPPTAVQGVAETSAP